jgi:hypothetical protein
MVYCYNSTLYGLLPMPVLIARMKFLPIAAVALLAGSCEKGWNESRVKAEPPSSAKLQSVTYKELPSVFAADRLVFERHPLELSAIAAPGAAIDAGGLIGKNREYGAMISPRLQLGAGSALRIGLHQEKTAMVRAGFRAIEAGVSAITETGIVVSRKPPDAPIGAILSDGDKASGAAFFLSDACTGMLALGASANPDSVADKDRRARVTKMLSLGVQWLSTQTGALQRADKAAPNRLFFDALAFQACGALSGDQVIQNKSVPFVTMALAQTRSDGVFVEGGGSDTTYQAVAVRLALDLLLSEYLAENRDELNLAWQRGAAWLGARILDDGRIDSTGNTRTCSGGESFLGTDKKVWPPGVYGALVYAGELAGDRQVLAAAGRLSRWAQANPRADPCFTR